MEVPLVIVNTVILLLSLPVIHGNGDMALDRSSPEKVYRSKYRMPPNQPMPFRDTTNNGMQQQYCDDHNIPNEQPLNSFMRNNHNTPNVQPPINSFMRNNHNPPNQQPNDWFMRKDGNIVDTLHRLETKIDHILNRADLEDNDHYAPNSFYDDGESQIGLIKELLSAVGSANQHLRIIARDFKEVMKNSRQSMQSLKKLYDIVQDTDTDTDPDGVSSRRSCSCSSGNPKSRVNMKPIGIGDESPRRSQDNSLNYAFNRKLRDGTETTETDLDKPIENGYQSPPLQYNTQNHELETDLNKPIENDYQSPRLQYNSQNRELETDLENDYQSHAIVQYNSQNHEFNDNEITGQSITSSTNPANQVKFESVKYNCDQLEIDKGNGIYEFASHDKDSKDGRFFNKRNCDFATEGVAWTVIQRRFTNNPQLSFNRTWSDYKRGFGDLAKEFWFGNDLIHKLTSERNMELRIIFEKDGKTDSAEYSTFKIESEEDQYKLVIEGYRGTIPDGLQYLNGQKFSTFDSRNDKNNNVSCASQIGNGWWFKNCTGNWLGSTTKKMMIRPKEIVKPRRSQSNNSTAKSKQK